MMLGWLVAVATGLLACDACGCVSMNPLNGQLYPADRSYVGLGHAFNRQFVDARRALDIHSMRALAGFGFARRFQLRLDLPVHHVARTTDDVVRRQWALGDLSVQLAWMAVDRRTEGGWKHTVVPMLGAALPTGRFDDENPDRLSTGTGAVTPTVALQYILRKGGAGLNILLDAGLPLRNGDDYRYGSRWAATAFAFVHRSVRRASYMPFAGVRAEHQRRDHHGDFVRPFTGGAGLFATGGLQWMQSGRWSIIIQGQFPLAQSYRSSAGDVLNAPRLQIQSLIHFNSFKKRTK